MVVIPRSELKTEARALIEAVEYYNTTIYRDLIPIHELGPHPGIYLVTPTHLRAGADFPDYIRLGLICTTLSHRINRIGDGTPKTALIKSFYRYRGTIIHSLRENIEVRHNHTGDLLVAGIISLLLADAHQGASPNWRCHLEGVHSLIKFRGGFRALSSTKSLDQLLLCFMFVAIIGNTTCPAPDLSMTGLHLEDLDIIFNKYCDRLFSFQMCPPLLFAEIIKINDVRMRALQHGPLEAVFHLQEACNILRQIHDFSPEGWSESKPCSKEGWMLVGNIYQAAVSLYCILSLQSLSVLPLSPELQSQCDENGRLLQVLLRQALSSPKTRYSMVWPLVLLGVQAANGDAATRAFVSDRLPELSYHIGSNVPMVAKAVLEKFWDSGETRWDACFDRPYAFATQIAVDMSQLLPAR